VQILASGRKSNNYYAISSIFCKFLLCYANYATTAVGREHAIIECQTDRWGKCGRKPLCLFESGVPGLFRKDCEKL
jgi:hypothetical protein